MASMTLLILLAQTRIGLDLGQAIETYFNEKKVLYSRLPISKR